jgi:hypothetical protein
MIGPSVQTAYWVRSEQRKDWLRERKKRRLVKNLLRRRSRGDRNSRPEQRGWSGEGLVRPASPQAGKP